LLQMDQIIHGNTLSVLNTLPSESIDCCICSPPYWSLRDYGIESQLGLEPTFNEYIINLQTIFDKVYRVLKKTGTCWVNIGDTYASNGNGSIPTKSLCNIPHRFAISMTDNGWIQRNTIIWHKPSCMPSSAKDRFTVDFDYVFLFSKNKKYYFEQQFEAQGAYRESKWRGYKKILDNPSVNNFNYTKEGGKPNYNPNGRNKRTVWRIPYDAKKGVNKLNDKPYTVQEREGYVAYRELPDIQVLGNYLNDARKRAGYTIEQVEAELDSQAPHHWFNGETYPTVDDWPRIKSLLNLDHTYNDAVTKEYLKPAEKMNYPIGRNMRTTWRINPQPFKGAHFAVFPEKLVEPMIKAGCPSDGIVLDPFVGSGTTALVARKLGRHYIGIDLNEDYVTIARKRVAELL